MPYSLHGDDLVEGSRLLKKSPLFRNCTDSQLEKIASGMEKRHYPAGIDLLSQGQESVEAFFVASGSIIRLREMDGVQHQMDSRHGRFACGSLHLQRKEPAFATARTTTDVEVYALPADHFNGCLTDSNLAQSVVIGLTQELKSVTRSMRTPLLEQKSARAPIPAISIAAAIESFYRSALNAYINWSLTGKSNHLFPNMHIQVPTRVVYINGFKLLRMSFDERIDPAKTSNPALTRLGLAFAPGILMTPVSSLLEATNAGHMNKEPMYTRWLRGLVPRCAREVIFGVGLNQLSDYCEERMPPLIENKALRTALGSMTAGVLSGYFSHVPHNLSTLKLLNPAQSYLELFRSYAARHTIYVPSSIKGTSRDVLATTIACVFPQAVLIRTMQIVGSFVILNGTINGLKGFF
jgi:hypothetical protein|eukprot:CAMPEP_0174304406 /NCGR_PEP_ID=MMETSP0809-20121228/60772_1 /TAXON_ID=73025 ORGANISM="Eutreptiella gymnastica-like, Strain CCMP1594" /NCGR_SAMPLE_ID=MMETSP0809 /ASSEMBLY_ACC=CAM_ASM_000658 /LENGTH=407 /DNA_ID=CAMNT_0015410637 /DNA_START=38 /DNA_END=1261 /DNA_ORIENTATION=-